MEVDNGPPEKLDSFFIKATNVPSEFFENRDVAKKYFRRFGKVKLVMFKPKRRALVIEYANEDGMLNALDLAGEFNNQVFNVTRDTQITIKKRKAKKNSDPEWIARIADPEVKAELEAMGGFGGSHTYNLRPEKMVVDSVEPPQTLKTKQRKWKNATASPKLTKTKSLGGKEVTMGSEKAELLYIIKQQAITVEEKFKVLDARDKLIRIKLKKNIEITKAKATVGTCPDMCPEKERLMREAQHQVAVYEQEENGKGMNPRLAVKQYLRSSADQEAPLPQELRPVNVLQMTMGYLMHRIMNLCDNPDVNMAEWYHFLWDRTRGIRKDITQQELCCQGSVELVEQCARFHIFCSARLVAEDPSVFDQKINTENLTKCLQTLKYMYHDLQLKGESCRNEPEFRAYIILLNLNDGNFMWEVQHLKQDIQQSREVKFALEVYSSLDKHNYVKFFKLVNSTTYLNACILMRYFIQVRVAAIKTLLKSYSPRISQAAIPVSYLTQILAFESDDVTVEFFETYGLFTDEKRRILLDRPSFADPEFPYVLDRAVKLVESKRQSSIGEVVCGRELPPKLFENHIPQNSFTEDGYLKSIQEIDEIDSMTKKEETTVTESKEKTEQPKIFATSAAPLSRSSSPSIFPSKQSEHSVKIFGQNLPEKKVFTNQEGYGYKLPVFNFFGKEEDTVAKPPAGFSFVKPETRKASKFGTSEEENKAPVSTNIFAKSEETTISTTKSLWSTPPPPNTTFFGFPSTQETIFGGENTTSFLPKTNSYAKVQEVKLPEPPPQPVVDQKKIEEEIRRKKEEEEEKMRKIMEEERRKAELEAKRRLEEQQKQLEEAKRAAIKRRQMEEEQRRKERDRQKAIEIKLIVSGVINELLNEVEENVKQERLAEISKRMHERKLKKVAMRWKENTRLKRKRKAIDFSPLWFGTRTLKEEAEELRIGSQDLALSSIKRYKRGKPCEIPLNEDNFISKIDLTELTYKFLVKRYMELEMKLPNELFWKVTVSLPNELEFKCGLNYVEKVLQNCIQWKERNSTTVLIEQSKTVPVITYCLEKQKGLIINKKRDGTNGVIFIANDFNDGLYKRITHYFRNCGKFVKIPVVFALQKYTENDPNLMSLIKEGIISEYLIIVDKFTSKNLVNIVEEALIFLSTKADKTPPLEMDTLKSFLSKYLCSDLWKRANSFAKWNSNYKNCLKNPNTVIYLHNEAVERLKKILLNETYREYSKFPEIFREFLRSEIPDALPCDYKYFPSFWDSPLYIKHVEKVLNEFMLPKFLQDWPPENQLQLEAAVAKYCTQCFKDGATFYRVMSVLLKNVDPSVNFKDICNVMWSDVVELMCREKLNQVNFSLYGSGFVNKSIYNQLIVIYNTDFLNDHVRSDWFYINNPIIKQKILQLLQEEAKEKKIIMKEEFIEDIDIDQILEKIKQPEVKDINKIKSELTDCKKILNDLEDTFVIHKRILEKSGSLLKSIIQEK